MTTPHDDFAFALMNASDLPFFLEIRNSCRGCLHNAREFSLEECRNWFDRESPAYYIITYQGVRVGYFRTSNYHVESLYIGADLAAPYRGKGLGYRAYLAFILYLRSCMRLRTLQLEVLSTNVRALRLYQKLGFVEVTRVPNAIERDGGSADNIHMELRICGVCTG